MKVIHFNATVKWYIYNVLNCLIWQKDRLYSMQWLSLIYTPVSSVFSDLILSHMTEYVRICHCIKSPKHMSPRWHHLITYGRKNPKSHLIKKLEYYISTLMNYDMHFGVFLYNVKRDCVLNGFFHILFAFYLFWQLIWFAASENDWIWYFALNVLSLRKLHFLISLNWIQIYLVCIWNGLLEGHCSIE